MNKKLVLVSSLLALCSSFEINADKNGLQKEMNKTFSVRVTQVVDSVNEEMKDSFVQRNNIQVDLAALKGMVKMKLEGKCCLADMLRPVKMFNAAAIADKVIAALTDEDIAGLNVPGNGDRQEEEREQDLGGQQNPQEQEHLGEQGLGDQQNPQEQEQPGGQDLGGLQDQEHLDEQHLDNPEEQEEEREQDLGGLQDQEHLDGQHLDNPEEQEQRDGMLG